jgi:hypothetical protein
MFANLSRRLHGKDNENIDDLRLLVLCIISMTVNSLHWRRTVGRVRPPTAGHVNENASLILTGFIRTASENRGNILSVFHVNAQDSRHHDLLSRSKQQIHNRWITRINFVIWCRFAGARKAICSRPDVACSRAPSR